MHRRTLLKVVALSALAARVDASGVAFSAYAEEGPAWMAANYQPAFFTAEEIALLDQVMEMIIPADQHSAGAHAAKVSLFADRMVSTGSDSGKTEWRDGLQRLKEEAAKSTVAEALARAADGEAHPQTDLEHFFVTLKQMTANGYYSSEIGIHQELEYQGNTYVAEFPGCGD
jgi:gluconate 2-dehydrogenase gamma chain